MTPSTKDQLDALIHRGSKKYALRDYDAAAELFAQACELYSASHETDSAALLFLYGRALFQLGVSKSDVLGGAKKEDGAEEAAAAAPEDDAAASTKKTKQDGEAKFQFAEDELKAQAQGDEDEQDEADGAEEEDQDGEQQSDLEVAWEILDTSRALFVTQIAQLADTETEKLTELEKGLADTYDVLGEVSLESGKLKAQTRLHFSLTYSFLENFEQAALDFAESLQLKKKNYEPLSSLISEAHFKLSLAYEFCVNDPAKPTVTGDDQGPSSSTDAVVRKNKERAVSEMQKAIAIVKEREASGDNTDKTLLKDLESRVSAPPTSPQFFTNRFLAD